MNSRKAVALLSTSKEAFAWACINQNVDLVDTMVSNGAVLSPNYTDPLISAIVADNVPVIEYLLAKGVLGMRGKMDPCALITAVMVNKDDYTVLELIADQANGFPPEHEYNLARPHLFGDALESAVRLKKYDLAVWILKYNPDLTSSYAFPLALKNDEHDISRLLLSKGASMYQCAGSDKTPIEIVANKPDGFRLFVENGVSVDSIKNMIPESLLYALYGSPREALLKIPTTASDSFKKLMVNRHIKNSTKDALTLMCHSPRILKVFYMEYVGESIR